LHHDLVIPSVRSERLINKALFAAFAPHSGEF
jgi:hypothetical protein